MPGSRLRLSVFVNFLRNLPIILADFRLEYDLLKMLSKILLVSILLSNSCVSSQRISDTRLGVDELHARVILKEPRLKSFRGKGPFSVSEKRGRELAIDFSNTLVIDHFYPQTIEKIPVIFITHGNYSSRDAHNAQARYLASWGFHVVVSDLPNRNQWIDNGSRLKALTELIYRRPDILGRNADTSRMILVGHSFGGSASVIAARQGAPVLGLVLLDPAIVHKTVLKDIEDIDLPVILLGADKLVFTSRGRDQFWKHAGGDILEISVPNATHDDAQGPSMFARSALGVDPFTSSDHQKTFRSMLAVAVVGLASSGTVDFALSIFGREESEGLLQDLRFRSAKITELKDQI